MPAPAASTGRVSAADSPSVCSPAAHVCDCDVRDGRRDREASTHTHKHNPGVYYPLYDTLYCTLQMGARLVAVYLVGKLLCLYTILLYCTVHIPYYKTQNHTRGIGFLISAHAPLSSVRQFPLRPSTLFSSRITRSAHVTSTPRFSQASQKPQRTA